LHTDAHLPAPWHFVGINTCGLSLQVPRTRIRLLSSPRPLNAPPKARSPRGAVVRCITLRLISIYSLGYSVDFGNDRDDGDADASPLTAPDSRAWPASNTSPRPVTTTTTTTTTPSSTTAQLPRSLPAHAMRNGHNHAGAAATPASPDRKVGQVGVGGVGMDALLPVGVRLLQVRAQSRCPLSNYLISLSIRLSLSLSLVVYLSR
jgi:hypothetical protein